MLSIVIPTWCDADRIEERVARARAIAAEVIVADASSPDGTARLAAEAGAHVIRAPRLRGAQLHAGALAARGDVLLFLPADALLEARAGDAIAMALADRRVVGGNFYLRFSGSSRAARLLTWLNDTRRRCMHLYCGASGIFVRRAVYDSIGGFKPLAAFEDIELSRGLERAGRTAYVRHVEVTASAHRLERASVFTLFVWALLQLLALAGVAPHRLARFHRHRHAAMSAAHREAMRPAAPSSPEETLPA